MVLRANGRSVRHFVYVSDRRLAAYVQEADDRPWRKILGKVQLTLGIPLGPVSATVPAPPLARPLSSRPKGEQVEAAEKSIRQASPVGDLANGGPDHWISGRVAMDWAPIGDGRTVLFCGYAGPLVVAMFGSIEHVTGPMASTGVPGSYFRPIKPVNISGPLSPSFGPELIAAASEICDQPQPVRFLAEVARRDTLAGDGPQREFLVARPLYVETAYDADQSASLPLRGTVRWFSIARGWGLIEPDNGADEVVVRSSELMRSGSQTIVTGQRVEFRVTNGTAGIEAISIRPVPSQAEEESFRSPEPDHGLPADFPGHGRIGSYLVRERLGEGTMGVIYLAHDPAGNPVAIKLIRPEYAGDPEFLRRFRMEAENARKVRAANVARVIAAATEGELPYLVTEYVAGLTLEEHVKRYGPLPNVAEVAAGIAEGLATIHKAGVIHQDLAPSNVILSNTGMPVIIDFGLARARRHTQGPAPSGQQVGTLYYTSPEQINQADVTEATDIFSWASVTAFAATGHPPFGGEEAPLMQVAENILNSLPDLGSISGNLRELLTAALDKDPGQRPKATQVLGHPAIHTSRPMYPVRPRRFRRGTGIVAGVIAAGVGIVLLVTLLPPSKPGSPAAQSSTLGQSSTPGQSRSVPSPSASNLTARGAGPALPLGLPSGYLVSGVAISPDGKTIVAVGKSLNIGTPDKLFLWNSSGKSEGSLGQSSDSIYSEADFDPSNGDIMAVSDLGGIGVWDLANRLPGTGLAVPNGEEVEGLAYVADGAELVEEDLPGNVYLLNTSTGNATHKFTDPDVAKSWNAVQAHPNTNDPISSFTGLATSASGGIVAAANTTGNVYVSGAADASRIDKISGACVSSSSPVAVSPDGKMIAISGTGTRLWSTADQKVFTTLSGHDTGAQAEAFSPDGATLAVGDSNGNIYLWDLATRQPVAVPSPITKWGGLAFSPNGKILAAFSFEDNKIYVYSIR